MADSLSSHRFRRRHNFDSETGGSVFEVPPIECDHESIEIE
jgi:hypothetical protein